MFSPLLSFLRGERRERSEDGRKWPANFFNFPVGAKCRFVALVAFGSNARAENCASGCLSPGFLIDSGFFSMFQCSLAIFKFNKAGIRSKRMFSLAPESRATLQVLIRKLVQKNPQDSANHFVQSSQVCVCMGV